eukprot:1195141-Prorocentrum_minimum.AAC.4
MGARTAPGHCHDYYDYHDYLEQTLLLLNKRFERIAHMRGEFGHHGVRGEAILPHGKQVKDLFVVGIIMGSAQNLLRA